MFSNQVPPMYDLLSRVDILINTIKHLATDDSLKITISSIERLLPRASKDLEDSNLRFEKSYALIKSLKEKITSLESNVESLNADKTDLLLRNIKLNNSLASAQLKSSVKSTSQFSEMKIGDLNNNNFNNKVQQSPIQPVNQSSSSPNRSLFLRRTNDEDEKLDKGKPDYKNIEDIRKKLEGSDDIMEPIQALNLIRYHMTKGGPVSTETIIREIHKVWSKDPVVGEAISGWQTMPSWEELNEKMWELYKFRFYKSACNAWYKTRIGVDDDQVVRLRLIKFWLANRKYTADNIFELVINSAVPEKFRLLFSMAIDIESLKQIATHGTEAQSRESIVKAVETWFVKWEPLLKSCRALMESRMNDAYVGGLVMPTIKPNKPFNKYKNNKYNGINNDNRINNGNSNSSNNNYNNNNSSNNNNYNNNNTSHNNNNNGNINNNNNDNNNNNNNNYNNNNNHHHSKNYNNNNYNNGHGNGSKFNKTGHGSNNSPVKK
ncbi:hypothetical protein CYY_010002 [Polysphondylium violaceum]|uniref:Uncharacterized protein n=1 Tax=Polysphondylium violaceum TaxID=133409 RepID=A0A8J4PLB9_9MYCE|nr:hypothetical protein CYY_010002 [Polysphondylium violaceum]